LWHGTRATHSESDDATPFNKIQRSNAIKPKFTADPRVRDVQIIQGGSKRGGRYILYISERGHADASSRGNGNDQNAFRRRAMKYRRKTEASLGAISLERAGSIRTVRAFITTWARARRVRIDSLTPGEDRRSRASAAATPPTRVTRHCTAPPTPSTRRGTLSTPSTRAIPKKQPTTKTLRRPEVRLPRPILVREQLRRRLRALHCQSHIVVRHAVRAHELLDLRIRHGLASARGLHGLELLH
jgi:hypothetical protein